jgi:protoporphyrinogen oxidase/SAM-dependent methyltransferase
MMRIAIVGGGPGGLLTAHMLERFCSGLCTATIFEATSRVGGKILTQRFETASVLYEAGVAELYDYSPCGPDPLRELVRTLGLKTVIMEGPAVILGDVILRNEKDIKTNFGKTTARALDTFYDRCATLFPPSFWYDGYWQDDNSHPWANRTYREVLDEIPDEIARRYVEVEAHSDLATEPHLTTALTGLKNILMDNPKYLRNYSIKGGIERFVTELRKQLTSEIVLNSPVVRVGRTSEGNYRVTTRRNHRFEDYEFDLVVMALPNYWLSRVEWEGRELRLAMQKHLAHYDYPAHYLRVSVLFKKPFWRKQMAGSFFMSDAFGGCCIYDEGARHPCEPYGVLGWLLAGNDALALSNTDDDHLVALALDSLPEPLAFGRALALEGKVQRWVGTLNGLPGGNPTHELRQRHVPAPDTHPGLIMVGDYLFDSTLNGVRDSADYATDLILTELRRRKYAYQNAYQIAGGEEAPQFLNGDALPIGKDYFELYDGEKSYDDTFEEYFCADYTTDIIRAVWGWRPPYTLLDCGSANGLTLEALDKKGVEATGIENNAWIHAHTKEKWRERNLLGDVCELPFEDGSFDFVYETCLCYVPEDKLDQAIREMFRVCRVGVYFGSITSDMTEAVIEKHDLFEGVQSLFPLWEWSERLMKAGFRPAINDLETLAKVWTIETEANEGGDAWYPDQDSMRCCFFSKPGAPPQPEKRQAAEKKRGKKSKVEVLAKDLIEPLAVRLVTRACLQTLTELMILLTYTLYESVMTEKLCFEHVAVWLHRPVRG